MEDQALELAKLVGAAVGAFVASWLGLIRPLDKKLRKSLAGPEDISALSAKLDVILASQQELSTKVTRLEERAAESRKRLDEALQDIKIVQEKLGRTVTDDEFASYVQTTASEVRGLSEKLGRATGAIEAWSRTQSGGR